MTIPADDLGRIFTLVRSDDPNLPHIWLVGDTYIITLWPAMTPLVATVSSTCTFHLAVALRLAMISKRCSLS
jgi:hypothetical protein